MSQSREAHIEPTCQNGMEVLRRKSMRGVWYVGSAIDLQGAWALISDSRRQNEWR